MELRLRRGFRIRLRETRTVSPSTPSAPATAPLKPGRVWLARLFFLLFFVIGSGLFYKVSILPLQEVYAARNWQETPCTIDSSKVVQVGGPHGAKQTYRVAIFYHYSIGNTRYTTSHYQFDDGGGSGDRIDKEKIVAQYPPGRETVCYINPTSPGQSVLNRSPNGEMFYGLIGLAFAGFGAIGLVSSFRLKSENGK